LAVVLLNCKCYTKLSPVRGERNASLCQLEGLTFLEIKGLQAKGLAGNWEVRGIAAMANACQSLIV
jgi:hypothetical protein